VSVVSACKAGKVIKVRPHRVGVVMSLNLLMCHKGFGFVTGC
jgi:hypothetical protein